MLEATSIDLRNQGGDQEGRGRGRAGEGLELFRTRRAARGISRLIHREKHRQPWAGGIKGGTRDTSTRYRPGHLGGKEHSDNLTLRHACSTVHRP
jgi:hypothetical protein